MPFNICFEGVSGKRGIFLNGKLVIEVFFLSRPAIDFSYSPWLYNRLWNRWRTTQHYSGSRSSRGRGRRSTDRRRWRSRNWRPPKHFWNRPPLVHHHRHRQAPPPHPRAGRRALRPTPAAAAAPPRASPTSARREEQTSSQTRQLCLAQNQKFSTEGKFKLTTIYSIANI